MFTNNWHHRHIKRWRRRLARYKGAPNINYLEIGVYEGASLAWMLENILTHPSSFAIGIDPWAGGHGRRGAHKRYRRAINNLEPYKKRCRIIRDYSANALKSKSIPMQNIIYIDGDHMAQAVYNDAILCWPKLKRKGLLIFDDYNLNPNILNRGIEGIPRTGIDRFITHIGNKIRILRRKGRQVFLRKIKV